MESLEIPHKAEQTIYDASFSTPFLEVRMYDFDILNSKNCVEIRKENIQVLTKKRRLKKNLDSFTRAVLCTQISAKLTLFSAELDENFPENISNFIENI